VGRRLLFLFSSFGKQQAARRWVKALPSLFFFPLFRDAVRAQVCPQKFRSSSSLPPPFSLFYPNRFDTGHLGTLQQGLRHFSLFPIYFAPTKPHAKIVRLFFPPPSPLPLLSKRKGKPFIFCYRRPPPNHSFFLPSPSPSKEKAKPTFSGVTIYFFFSPPFSFPIPEATGPQTWEIPVLRQV